MEAKYPRQTGRRLGLARVDLVHCFLDLSSVCCGRYGQVYRSTERDNGGLHRVDSELPLRGMLLAAGQLLYYLKECYF